MDWVNAMIFQPVERDGDLPEFSKKARKNSPHAKSGDYSTMLSQDPSFIVHFVNAENFKVTIN